jgi:hypothetical protein
MGIKSFGTEFCAAERVEIYFAKAVWVSEERWLSGAGNAAQNCEDVC